MDDQTKQSANELLKQKEYTALIELLDQAIAQNFLDAEALLLRGKAFLGLKQYERAVESFEKAIGTDPNFGGAHLNKGWAYFHLGDYHQAITDFTQACRLNPEWEEPYHGLGSSYAALQNHDAAIICFSQAVAAKPTFAMALAERALMYEQTSRLDEAVADMVIASYIFETLGKKALAQSAFNKAMQWKEANS